jgi:hypothetical protein
VRPAKLLGVVTVLTLFACTDKEPGSVKPPSSEQTPSVSAEDIAGKLVAAEIPCDTISVQLSGADSGVKEKRDCSWGDGGYRINVFASRADLDAWLTAAKADRRRSALGFCYLIGSVWALEVPNMAQVQPMKQVLGGRIEKHPTGPCYE